MCKRMLSLLLMMIMLCTAGTVYGSSADIDWNRVDRDKIKRTAYIHANTTDPSIDGPSYTKVYAGEDVNVYAAVDLPNKGRKNADGTHDISENQYNLNSYVVKFYFDPTFFDLVYCDTKTHKNPSLTQGADQSAINYMLPFQTLGLTFEDAAAKNISGWTEDEMKGVMVDYTDRSLPNVSTQNIYGKDYTVVQGVFVLQGEETLFPEAGSVLPNWYNLCNITLRPKVGVKGSTEVMIETGAVSNDGIFELIPKHKSGYPWSFKDSTEILNGGYHQIIIGDTAPVNPPIPDIKPGAYVYPEYGDMVIHLETETADCQIFYTTDTSIPKYPNDAEYILYDSIKGIKIPYTSTLRCYARKLIGNSYKYSYVMDYNYIIEPPAPTLFFADGSKVPYYYYTDSNKFYVYGTDKIDADGNISNMHEIYYTFSPSIDLAELKIGANNNDPETSWVKLDKISREIEIDKTTSVRLVTLRGTSDENAEFSTVSLYMLYIMPAPVNAVPSSNPGDSSPFDVILTSDSTKSGADILFTTDGSDPRTNGIRYTEPVRISKNTTIRAVAFLNGAYSKMTAFNYLFDELPVLTVSAIPYPGEYNEYADVCLTTGNPDDIIYYTTDGSSPYASGIVYDRTTPIHIDKDTTICAAATSGDGKNKGDIAYFKYTIIPDAPVLVPSSTQFNEKSNVVTIFKPHQGEQYKLYYTVDGSDPRTSATRKQTSDDKAEVVVTSSSIINAVIKNSSGHYSKLATGSYEIISGRPVRPEVTLIPGIYVYENDRTEPFTTSFYTQPEGVKIYYTVGLGETPPNPTEENGMLYDGGNIPILGNTIIKAVAVDESGKQSDLGVYYYTIVPEGPSIPESAVLPNSNNILLPVSGITGSAIHYTVGNAENNVELDGFNQFWVDPITGKAYKNEDGTVELGNPVPSGVCNTSPFELTAYAVLDGIKGEESRGTYTYSVSAATVLPPYASIPSGCYEERAIDENCNGIIEDGEDTLIELNLYSLTKGADIYYYYAGNPGEVYRYDGTLNIKDDCVIYMYAEKDGIRSSENIAFYKFIPLAPVIKPVSGIYKDKIDIMITENPFSPNNANHTIYYKKSSDMGSDIPYLGGKITVEKDEIIKAYTIKDYNPLDKNSGTYSKKVYEYYVFAGAAKPGSGKIYVNSPFDYRHIFAGNELLEMPCSQGITLSTPSGYNIIYKYEVTLKSGETYSVSEGIFKPGSTAPIYPSVLWDKLKITAWLEDDEGNMIEDSLADFSYSFVVLNKPISSLAETDGKGNLILYTKGTQYKLINEYGENERNIKLYYTLDGSDPSENSAARKEFKSGDILTLNESTTLRAIYMETCDGISFFGPEAKYIYALKTSSGGGGGSSGGGGGRGSGSGSSGQTVDKTRKYTKDIFGNEHPTHIGYIKGYPDGSVRPNGAITREEMAAILYRIKNKEYDEPFATSGSIFPDVNLSRWSVTEIEYMTRDGVVEGYPNGEYKPQNNLTRAEFAALIHRFIQWIVKEDESNKSENIFSDLSESHWAYADIMYLYKAGLLNGYEDGTIKAENDITRAEVMTVVNKLLGRNPSESYVKSLNYNPFNDLKMDKWYYVIVLEATITHNYYLDDKGVEIKWEDCK